MAGARHGFILSLIPSFNKRYDTLFRFRDGCSVLTINPQRLFGELPAQFSSPPPILKMWNRSLGPILLRGEGGGGGYTALLAVFELQQMLGALWPSFVAEFFAFAQDCLFLSSKPIKQRSPSS